MLVNIKLNLFHATLHTGIIFVLINILLLIDMINYLKQEIQLRNVHEIWSYKYFAWS